MVMGFCGIICAAVAAFLSVSVANTQNDNLPDMLQCADGSKVTSEQEWNTVRRAEIVSLLEENEYGRIPSTAKFEQRFREISVDKHALGGKATRKQIAVTFSNDEITVSMDLLIYLPNRRSMPSPVFLGMNFGGNYTVADDKGIVLPDADRYHNPKYKVDESRRGTDSSSWAIDDCIDRGYGVATFFTGDVFEDFAGGVDGGVSKILYPKGRDRTSCGFLGISAWACSRAMDYLVTDSDVDAAKVAVIGTSRNGKAALWAGATDRRFAITVSSSSGTAGASLYRGNSTETVADINRRFPYWVCGNFKNYATAEELPFDQHMLLGLIAPRGLYVANSDRDKYVKAKDDFAALTEASKVYELFGAESLPAGQPVVGEPISTDLLGYHTKSGEHSITRYDWLQYLNFADRFYAARDKADSLVMPPILSDHMVLQQRSKMKLWGRAVPDTEVTINVSWSKKSHKTTSGQDGRWMVELSTPCASRKPCSIEITTSRGERKTISDVLIGEVWICSGQSNMEMPMRGFGSIETNNFQPIENSAAEIAAANIPLLRYYKAKPTVSVVPTDRLPGMEWLLTTPITVPQYSAISYFFGKKLVEELNIPVGIVVCSYSGTRIESWMPPYAIAGFSDRQYKTAAELGSQTHKSAPSMIYNAMVKPLSNFSARGWIWFQGESNRDNGFAYADLLTSMVASWRADRGDAERCSMPFYIMQLAPFTSVDKVSAAIVREAQMTAYGKIPNSGIACASDMGNPHTIHSDLKKVPAERLALWALRYQYGRNDITALGPVYRGKRLDGNGIIVALSGAKNLRIAGGKVEDAEVAGADGKFYPAEAVVCSDGCSVRFSSSFVSEPLHVRYCFRSWHKATIFSDSSLPVYPFRTDAF